MVLSYNPLTNQVQGLYWKLQTVFFFFFNLWPECKAQRPWIEEEETSFPKLQYRPRQRG